MVAFALRGVKSLLSARPFRAAFDAALTKRKLRRMHTWALICQLTLMPAQCNLETADRWFEVAPNRPINVRAVIMRLGIFHPATQFIKIFKYGGSLGTDTYIYYPCDSPDSIAEALKDASQDVRDQQSKGGCLSNRGVTRDR
jgi:hypothetical protein